MKFRFSIRDLLKLTALLAVEVFLTRQVVFLDSGTRGELLIAIWLAYGIAMGMSMAGIIAGPIAARFPVLVAFVGALLGAVCQILLWAWLWLDRLP